MLNLISALSIECHDWTIVMLFDKQGNIQETMTLLCLKLMFKLGLVELTSKVSTIAVYRDAAIALVVLD